jgi:hypothetical protein
MGYVKCDINKCFLYIAVKGTVQSCIANPLIVYTTCGVHNEAHTEWQRPLGVHSIMMEKFAQAGEGRGVQAHAPPFTIFSIYRTKLQCTLQLRGQIHSPYFISTVQYISMYSVVYSLISSLQYNFSAVGFVCMHIA